MITLIMAMFILMLSLSTLNLEKFRDQAIEMQKAFNHPDAQIFNSVTRDKSDFEVIDEDVIATARQRRWRFDTMGRMREALANEIAAKSTTVLEIDNKIVIRFSDTAAFASGSAELRDSILPGLDRVASVLKEVEGQVVVSGHTDNIPIVNDRFQSNWELAVTRAVAVVHYFLKDGRLASGRLTAQGFADSRPLADNSFPEGRAVNRRVEVSLDMPEEFVAERARGAAIGR